ncbi:MAG TPA: hypothetical protein VHI52_16235 [Verrucomicrobiae bacterium]|nr:hypothetical protein [Verrucomicrobiae bacterium]
MRISSCRVAKDRKPAIGLSLAYLSAAWLVYLLSLGPLSRLKTSGTIDRLPGGWQAMDAFAWPGLVMLRTPGIGAAYETYLRWWDDIDKPG